MRLIKRCKNQKSYFPYMKPPDLSLFLVSWCFLFLFFSCSQNGKVKKEVRRITLEEVKVNRYEESLFNIDTANIGKELGRLQQKFNPFLNADLADQHNIEQIRGFISDTVVRNIYWHVNKQFTNLAFLEEELSLAFRHIKYYFPDWTPPRVYTYVSGLYYEDPVMYNGEELIIAIDMFLGEDFDMYRKIGIPLYRIRRMTPEHLTTNSIDEIIRSGFVSSSLPDNMLDRMIEEGKIFYLLDLFLPWISDEYKIGYTKEQLKWCRQNESNMWAYFIENNLLFSSDPVVINRFINDGPFTAAFHRESPARAALWVGWQITEAFMERNRDVTPADLIALDDAGEILRASAYKPRRFRF
jgi:hypothetical protein